MKKDITLKNKHQTCELGAREIATEPSYPCSTGRQCGSETHQKTRAYEERQKEKSSQKRRSNSKRNAN